MLPRDFMNLDAEKTSFRANTIKFRLSTGAGLQSASTISDKTKCSALVLFMGSESDPQITD